MSHRGGKKVDLKLNLELPTTSRRRRAASDDDGDSSSSSPSSCLSSDGAESPEATSSMVLAACPRCLMYVMLSRDDPKCPKCKSAVLLDFLHDGGNATKNNTRKS
ncbi:hypothetical protein Cni_G09569 [Canna indica]|uniref:GIR1-like zinc ribbon domain-containing protein n=1 Tax=Canna indica TaxID=4628 RepID=A0AAQ3Q909_9LILI|nr:hypothetical protein Cni_G09569 [Canna indica]